MGGAGRDTDYRERFVHHGSSALTGSWDLRRKMTFAPYFVVPSVAIVSNWIPKQYRITVWISTLVAYGLVSTIMYNTDSSSDDPSPAVIRVASPREED